MPDKKSVLSNFSEEELGTKLRSRRRELGLTMQSVANQAGLSIGFISQVETGLSTPSLSSLAAISKILQMPIAYFLEQPPEAAQPVTRKANRQPFQTGADALTYERLSAELKDSSIRALIVHEPPGHRTEQICHAGEELFYVLKGSIMVEIEDEKVTLTVGDSVHFDSSRRHSSWNFSSEVCTYMHVRTLDVFDQHSSLVENAEHH